MKIIKRRWKFSADEPIRVPAGTTAAFHVQESPDGMVESVCCVISDAAGKEVARIPCRARLLESQTLTRPSG